MATKKDNEREAWLAELDLHKLEFSALRQEILQLIESERQYLNMSLVAIGAGLSFASYVAGKDSFVILLLFPFVFHILFWEMLKSIKSVLWISNYLLDLLIPRVNYILNSLGRTDQTFQTLGWETHISSRQTMTKVEIFFASLSPSRHWIPILAVAASIFTYLLLSDSYGHVPTQYELWLIYIHLILLIWVGIQTTLIARSDSRKTKKSKKE
ncbi:MAG: hypothetical protein ABI904_18080 [Chloroflexota bacterium]